MDPHHKMVVFFYHQSSHHHSDEEHHQKVNNKKRSASDLVMLGNGADVGDADDNAVEEVAVVDKKTVVVLVVD